MREESHLDEMRTAIRGDFERLKERRGEQELMRVVEEEPAPDGDVTVAEQADPAPVADVAPAGPVATEVVPEPEPEVGPEPGVQDETEPKRSWLQRVLSP